MLSSDRPDPRICAPGLVRFLVRVFLTSVRLRTPVFLGGGALLFWLFCVVSWVRA